ncbi:hypothetical protein ABPG72_000056 [Tetrahymena utriculariae]
MDDNFDITNPGIEQNKSGQIFKKIIMPSSNTQQNLLSNTMRLKSERKKLNQSDDEADKLAQERKERYWEQTMAKIAFTPPDENYYKEKKYVVKPGFGLFKAFASARVGFNNLHINIPETLMVQESNTFLLYTDEYGRVRRKADSSWIEFEAKCRREHEYFCLRFKQSIEGQSKNRKFNERMSIFELSEKLDIKQNPECPVMILRGQAQNDWKLSQNVYQAKTLNEKRQTDASNSSVEQRFIFSRPMKATLIRLVYNTRNSKDTVANYAFRIQSYNEIFDPDLKKNINLKACINQEKKNSFDVQNVKGNGLKEYERQAESLVRFLEKNNQIRIRLIVLDFIQDLEGKIWLISMKSIRAENTISMEEIMAKKANTDEEDSKKTLDQLTCSVYCKLCGILFKKDDASKVLTYKLLWELVQHLKKRNIPLNNIKVSHSSTRPCRVCNLCYMLVVGEHELIEIEQKFAEAQNIPIYDAVIRVPIDTKPKHRPALLSETLNQWRLLFYICDISNIGIDQNIDFQNLYFQYKLHNYKTSFKISVKDSDSERRNLASDQNSQNRNSFKSIRSDQVKSPTNQQQQHAQSSRHYSHLSMNHIRVHYFFSEDLNIEKFLKDTQIKVRLTQGPDWNAFLAEGSSKTISHFKNKEQGGQRHSSQILLFFENAKYCVLKINAGLVCDGEYNTGKLNLHKHNDIYFPDESFYNSNPFPDEWMEMFDPQYVSRKEDMKEQEGTEKYSPKCTPAELNKMIDFNSHKSKLNAQSKVSQIIRAKSAVTIKQQTATPQQNQTPAQFSAKNQLLSAYGFEPNEHQQNYTQNTQKNMQQQDQDQIQSLKDKRAATAKDTLRKNQSEQKIKRPVTSLQAYNTQGDPNLKSQPGQDQRPQPKGSYGFLLGSDDKKSRAEMLASIKKYGQHSNDDDDDEFDDMPDETEEIITEKLKEHFKLINKMNENQYEQQQQQ